MGVVFLSWFSCLFIKDDLPCCAPADGPPGLGLSPGLRGPAAGQQVLHLLGVPRVWAKVWEPLYNLLRQRPLLAGVRPPLPCAQDLQPLDMGASQVRLSSQEVLPEKQ